MKPTRPLRVLYPFVGDSVGGSHLATLSLIEHLDRDRVDPRIVVGRDGPLTEFLAGRGIRFRVVPIGPFAGEAPGQIGAIASAIRAAPAVAGVVRAEEADAVHTNDLRCHLTWGPASRLSGAGWIWHSHQLLSGSFAWRALSVFASATIVVSPQAAATLPGPAARKSAILPNPFGFSDAPDRVAARAALARELGIDADRPIVAYVGNMTRQKRPGIFAAIAIRLAALSVAAVPFFILIGDDRGGERTSVEAMLRRAGLSDSTRVLGFRHPLEPTLAAVDVLVAPGVGDSFGRTLVEALAVGTAVVASDSGGHAFILTPGGTGLLFPPDDATAAATAVARLLADASFRRDLASAGARDVRARFAAPAIAAAVMDIYDRVMGA